MAKRLSEQGYGSYAAAESAFIAEGGHVDPRFEEEPVLDDAAPQRIALMAQYAIRYNGSHYSCNGMRYMHLADAVNHARQVLAREADRVRQRDPGPHPGIDSPTEAERRTMAQLSITCRDGVYSFAGFDYHHLSDAVHFATLRHSSDDGVHPV